MTAPDCRRDEGEQQPTGQPDHAERGDLAGREGADLVGLDGREGGRGSVKIKKGGGTGGSDGVGDLGCQRDLETFEVSFLNYH